MSEQTNNSISVEELNKIRRFKDLDIGIDRYKAR